VAAFNTVASEVLFGVYEAKRKASRPSLVFEIPFQDYGDRKFWTLPEILTDVLGAIPSEIGILSASNVMSAEMMELIGQGGMSVKVRDVSHILAKARYEKSPAEFEMYRIASGIATEAMRTLLNHVRPGLRELELADPRCGPFRSTKALRRQTRKSAYDRSRRTSESADRSSDEGLLIGAVCRERIPTSRRETLLPPGCFLSPHEQ
jgi:hypothetical protein